MNVMKSNPPAIEEELLDIKRELDRLDMRGAGKTAIVPLLEHIATIQEHLGRDKKFAA